MKATSLKSRSVWVIHGTSLDSSRCQSIFKPQECLLCTGSTSATWHIVCEPPINAAAPGLTLFHGSHIQATPTTAIYLRARGDRSKLPPSPGAAPPCAWHGPVLISIMENPFFCLEDTSSDNQIGIVAFGSIIISSLLVPSVAWSWYWFKSLHRCFRRGGGGGGCRGPWNRLKECFYDLQV